MNLNNLMKGFGIVKQLDKRLDLSGSFKPVLKIFPR